MQLAPGTHELSLRAMNAWCVWSGLTPKGADAGSLDRPETTFGRGSARERSGMGCSS